MRTCILLLALLLVSVSARPAHAFGRSFAFNRGANFRSGYNAGRFDRGGSFYHNGFRFGSGFYNGGFRFGYNGNFFPFRTYGYGVGYGGYNAAFGYPSLPAAYVPAPALQLFYQLAPAPYPTGIFGGAYGGCH